MSAYITEYQYHHLLQRIKDEGQIVPSRTGIDCISLFAPDPLKFYLNDGATFPLLTKKKVNFNTILKELLWFISGSTNVNDLDSKIWNAWADEEGDLGNIYGYQLRRKRHLSVHYGRFNDEMRYRWNYLDPLKDTINNIRTNPHSRRHVITLWDHKDLPDESISPQDNVANGKQALACCHGTVIQFYVNGNELDMYHYQRSADFPIGVPFNIASYATLLMMVARVCNLKAGMLTCAYGDAHIYSNQLSGVDILLNREVLNNFPSLEIVNFSKGMTIDDFTIDNFGLKNYHPQDPINFEIAV